MSNRSFYHPCLLHDVCVFLAIRIRNRHQHAPEAGPPIVVSRREVGSAVKRLAVRRKKYGEWPATLSTDGLHRDLIAAVNVGALVTVHFDRYKTFIHDLRNFWIVVRLAVHHM